MKKIFSVATLLYCGICSYAQPNWNGAWQGRIEIANLRIIFNVANAETGAIKVTMDSPDQAAFGLPVESAEIKGDSILLADSRYKISYSGKRVNDSTINGVFTQGAHIPMELKRSVNNTPAKKTVRRQTPVPPFPYKTEEVSIVTKSGIKLSGTVTIPGATNGKAYPAVILVSGSGPQDRDETIFNHKPFAVLADHLTRNGMVVLRYDDRGTGKSTGDFSSSTTLDFAHDASAALDFLVARGDVDKKRIGIIGHSEGGMIAPMVANMNNKTNFIVLLAGPGIPVKKLMAEQNIAIFQSNGVDSNAANKYGKLYSEAINISLKDLKEEDKIKEVELFSEKWMKDLSEENLKALGIQDLSWSRQFATSIIKETSGKWMHFFLAYDPEENLKNLKVKVLALNGNEDRQVIAETNLKGIESALKKSKSPSYTVKVVPGLNHLFQTCSSCTVSEYGSIDETFSPIALEEISSWLIKEGIINRSSAK